MKRKSIREFAIWCYNQCIMEVKKMNFREALIYRATLQQHLAKNLQGKELKEERIYVLSMLNLMTREIQFKTNVKLHLIRKKIKDPYAKEIARYEKRLRKANYPEVIIQRLVSVMKMKYAESNN